MMLRRGRVHLVKIVISVAILLAVFYLLFSNSDAPARAKSAIQSRLTANKPKEKPFLGQGMIIYLRQLKT